MTFRVARAETQDEREAIYRFRYQIYVKEMGRYQDVADHRAKSFSESVDEQSRLFYAERDGEVVATSRMTWGGDGPFPERQVDQYQMALFLEHVPAEAIAVGERAMVKPDLRGTDLFMQLMAETIRFANEKRIQLFFGASEPHLLSLYQSLGMRTFAERNFNSAEAGYLIPQLLVLEDVDYFRKIRSPFAQMAQDFGADRRVPVCLEELLGDGSAVLSRRLVSGEAYWQEIHEALESDGGELPGALDGLDEGEVDRYLAKSNIIECQSGDKVVKKGGISRNLYVLLEGTLEVRDGRRVVAVISPGEVFGEMSFLLERPRSMDVVAAVDGTRVLSLSESALRQMIEDDSRVAATVLLNVSKMLCWRLLKMN